MKKKGRHWKVFSFLRNFSSKRGCRGKVKLDEQGLAQPNCSQINFKKNIQIWWP